MKFLLASLSLLAMAPFVSSHLNNLEDDSYDLDWNSDQPNLRGHHKYQTDFFRPINKGKWDKEYQGYQSEPAPQCDSNSSPILQLQKSSFPEGYGGGILLQLSDGRYRLVIKLPGYQDQPQSSSIIQNKDLITSWYSRQITLTKYKDYYQGFFDVVSNNWAFGQEGGKIYFSRDGDLQIFLMPQFRQKYPSVNVKIYPVCTTLIADNSTCNLVRNGNFQIGTVQKNTKCIPYWQTQGKVSLEYGKKYNQKLPAEQKVVVLKKDSKIRQRFNLFSLGQSMPVQKISLNQNASNGEKITKARIFRQPKNQIIAKIKCTVAPGPQKQPILAVLLSGLKIDELKIKATEPSGEYVVRYEISKILPLIAADQSTSTLELVTLDGSIVIEYVEVYIEKEVQDNFFQPGSCKPEVYYHE